MLKILLVFTVILVIVTIINFLTRKKPWGYQYRRKNFLMTRSEHECYTALLTAIGEKYYVFPQIHLPTILDHKIIHQNWAGAFLHISQKSVDYVLCDKVDISPKLAIELDDSSHERPDRIERDKEVERILMGAGLPLLRLKNREYTDTNKLIEKINTILN